MTTKHGKVVTHREGLPPIISYFNPWNMRSHDKLKTYLRFYNACGHKTYQGGDILQEAPTYKFAWPLNEVVMVDNVTN